MKIMPLIEKRAGAEPVKMFPFLQHCTNHPINGIIQKDKDTTGQRMKKDGHGRNSGHGKRGV